MLQTPLAVCRPPLKIFGCESSQLLLNGCRKSFHKADEVCRITLPAVFFLKGIKLQT